MYFPSTRLLNILDLLRAHGQLTANQLAQHLEVDARSVRRYMVMLEDMGMPVETVRGRHGGYRLRAGYRLPPVVFSDNEALTLVLGLLLAERLGVTNNEAGLDLTLSKLSRVAPAELRDQIHLLGQALTLRLPSAVVEVAGQHFLLLTLASYRRQPVHLKYVDTAGAETQRLVDPYGLVFTIGLWYLAGYCHLRQGLRTFRLDRIQQIETREGAFQPPPAFDILAYVEESIARKPWGWSTQVQLYTTLAAAKIQVPQAMAILEENADGVLLHCQVDDLRQHALFLLGLSCELTILEPVELRREMAAVAQRAERLGAT
ncbi:MAG: YafY family protein [Caldilineaceae bacterium]